MFLGNENARAEVSGVALVLVLAAAAPPQPEDGAGQEPLDVTPCGELTADDAFVEHELAEPLVASPL
jgi:hypothetical protein